MKNFTFYCNFQQNFSQSTCKLASLTFVPHMRHPSCDTPPKMQRKSPSLWLFGNSLTKSKLFAVGLRHILRLSNY